MRAGGEISLSLLCLHANGCHGLRQFHPSLSFSSSQWLGRALKGFPQMQMSVWTFVDWMCSRVSKVTAAGSEYLWPGLEKQRTDWISVSRRCCCEQIRHESLLFFFWEFWRGFFCNVKIKWNCKVYQNWTGFQKQELLTLSSVRLHRFIRGRWKWPHTCVSVCVCGYGRSIIDWKRLLKCCGTEIVSVFLTLFPPRRPSSTAPARLQVRTTWTA